MIVLFKFVIRFRRERNWISILEKLSNPQQEKFIIRIRWKNDRLKWTHLQKLHVVLISFILRLFLSETTKQHISLKHNNTNRLTLLAKLNYKVIRTYSVWNLHKMFDPFMWNTFYYMGSMFEMGKHEKNLFMIWKTKLLNLLWFS